MSTRIDGKRIADKNLDRIARSLSGLPRAPRADIIVVGEDPATESFIRIKARTAARLRIELTIHRYPDTISTEELSEAVRRIGATPGSDALIVQLPLPIGIDTGHVLDAIPESRDVDMLTTASLARFSQGEASLVPPVAAAVKEVLDDISYSVHGKEALVLGYGRLVGKPVSLLLRHNGAHVTVIDRPVPDLAIHARESSLIVSGVGSPKLVTKEMLAPGTVVIDAGASESDGTLVGDLDPACEDESDLAFTPVPGGVGPITVAMLMKNIAIVARRDIMGTER